ncbi:MAG: hypothetical protein OEU54_12235 [Gemmatimonadota bacterium]|nr:hypothetical protein [Gemmatimonadota bacterium]
MNRGEQLTALAASAMVAARPLIRFVRPDLGRSLDERIDGVGKLEEWAQSRGEGTLVWLHGASAGELLGAVPAIEELRARRDFRLLVTHFSPSGRTALDRLHPDFAVLAPLDRPKSNRTLMAALRPDLVVFAKLDVWPGLVAAAGRAGVPAALVNGTVRPGSSRLRWPARRLFRPAYRGLRAVGAASAEDAERLRALGAGSEAVQITGDASFDLARARARAARGPGAAVDEFESVLPARPVGGRRLIAGSTWEADERALLESLGALPATSEGRFAWQLVVAPHKPSVATVRRILGDCRAGGHPAALWSDRAALSELPAHGVIVFDEMGRLAELYGAGEVAYVGGGLGSGGLHNVLEPAAAGVPVLFGPRYDRADAADLVAAGGGFEVTPADLRVCLERLSRPEPARSAGEAAAAFIGAGCGAARESADLLEALLVPETRARA